MLGPAAPPAAGAFLAAPPSLRIVDSGDGTPGFRRQVASGDGTPGFRGRFPVDAAGAGPAGGAHGFMGAAWRSLEERLRAAEAEEALALPAMVEGKATGKAVSPTGALAETTLQELPAPLRQPARRQTAAPSVAQHLHGTGGAP